MDVLEMDMQQIQRQHRVFKREADSRTLVQRRRATRQGHAQRTQRQPHHQISTREGDARTLLQPRRDMLQGHARRLGFHVEIIQNLMHAPI